MNNLNTTAYYVAEIARKVLPMFKWEVKGIEVVCTNWNGVATTYDVNTVLLFVSTNIEDSTHV